jgi:hypothetical protein
MKNPVIAGAPRCPACMAKAVRAGAPIDSDAEARKTHAHVQERASARKAIHEKKRPAYERYLPDPDNPPEFKPLAERAKLYPDNFERWTKHGELVLGEGGYRSQAAVKAALMGLMAVCEREGYSLARILADAERTLDEQWAQDDHRRERGFRGIMLDELAAREIERASMRREREAKKRSG